MACAAAGANVCHVDAAKGMVSWARENAKLSGLEQAPVRWIVDDCAKFVEREIRRGRRYDALIMDPPSYGRGPSGEIWKLEENLYPFLELVVQVLSDQPLFVLINSYTTGLAPAVLTYLLDTLVTKRHGGHTDCSGAGSAGDRLRPGAALRRHGTLDGRSVIEKEPKRMNATDVKKNDNIIQFDHVTFQYNKEEGKPIQVLKDIYLGNRRRAPLWPSWGTTAAASPRWPST